MSIPVEFSNYDQFLKETDPTKKYERRTGKTKTTVAWSLRSLIISNIQFLISCLNPLNRKGHVVYPFSSPGYDVQFLASLFPDLTFHCYDLRPYKISETTNIKLYQQKFGTDTAYDWADKADDPTTGPIYLIIKYRSQTWHQVFAAEQKKTSNNRQAKKAADAQFEKIVEEDMIRQRNIVTNMQPDRASIMIRLPYPTIEKTEFEYFSGYATYIPWGSQTSTETNLSVKKDEHGLYETTKWNLQEYEEKMFYHNAVRRELTEYKNILDHSSEAISPPELLNDYDSNLEIYVLANYIWQHLGYFKASEVIRFSQEITKFINQVTKKEINLAMLRQAKISETEIPSVPSPPSAPTPSVPSPPSAPTSVSNIPIANIPIAIKQQMDPQEILRMNVQNILGPEYDIYPVLDDKYNLIHAVSAASGHENYKKMTDQFRQQYAVQIIRHFLNQMNENKYQAFDYFLQTHLPYSSWKTQLEQFSIRHPPNMLLELLTSGLDQNIFVLDNSLKLDRMMGINFLSLYASYQQRKASIVLLRNDSKNTFQVIYRKPNTTVFPTSDPFIQGLLNSIKI